LYHLAHILGNRDANGAITSEEIMKLHTGLLHAVFATAAILAVSQPAYAEHREHGWDRHRDIRHFQSHDLHRWNSGRWVHGHHDGYLGWWWVVAGLWYFYPSPVYPYPDPYTPSVVVQQSPPVIVQQAPATPTPPPAPAEAPSTPQYWYYCEPASMYYPYVSSCPTGWKKVPAVPPDAPK
jgi:hypothetical protein